MRRPPDAHDIRLEVEVITDGQVAYGGAQAATGGGPFAGGELYTPANDVAGRDLVIPHIRQVQVRVAQGGGYDQAKEEVRPM